MMKMSHDKQMKSKWWEEWKWWKTNCLYI